MTVRNGSESLSAIVGTRTMLAFCEKRQDFRNFRFDRITELAIVQQKLNAPRRVMLAFYTALSGDDEL